jgi:hypothetical protein
MQMHSLEQIKGAGIRIRDQGVVINMTKDVAAWFVAVDVSHQKDQTPRFLRTLNQIVVVVCGLWFGICELGSRVLFHTTQHWTRCHLM